MAEGAFVTLGGFAVLAGTLTMPTTGAWVARLHVAADVAPTGPVDLVVGDATWRGVVRTGGSPYGRLHVVVVGGADRLGATVDSRDFLGVPARVPLADTVEAAGEVLAPLPAATADFFLASWARLQGRASAALGALAAVVGGRWRVLADGTVWVGADAGAPSAAKGTLVDEWPDEGARVYGLDGFALYPGQTFDDHAVGEVVHVFDAAATRTIVWPP